MAHPLSDSDQEHMKDLQENKTARLDDFRRKWSIATKTAIKEERTNIENYLAACSRSEVDDTLDNIRFMADKAGILRKLEEDMSSDNS